MQEHWRSIALAAAQAALEARVAHGEDGRREPAQHGTIISAPIEVAPASVRAGMDRFRSAGTQRQISTYLLYRSLSTDDYNGRRLESWREALRRRNSESL